MHAVHFNIPASSAVGIIIPYSNALSLGDLNKVQESNIPNWGGFNIWCPFSQIVQSPITSSKNSVLPNPVSWKKFDFFLCGYDKKISNALMQGFKHGFSIHFSGDIVPVGHKTLMSAKQNPDIVNYKLARELQKGRIAGPFHSEPFIYFITSQIGLVPKKTKGQFRLIHHLSYPKHTSLSVNAGIPQNFKSVSYSTIGDTISYLRMYVVRSFMATRGP